MFTLKFSSFFLKQEFENFLNSCFKKKEEIFNVKKLTMYCKIPFLNKATDEKYNSDDVDDGDDNNGNGDVMIAMMVVVITTPNINV